MRASVALARTVPYLWHMGSDDLKDRYLEGLSQVSLTGLARGTGRAIRTLTAYRRGERRVTEAAARELVGYLRSRSESLSAAAAALEAALEKEEPHG